MKHFTKKLLVCIISVMLIAGVTPVYADPIDDLKDAVSSFRDINDQTPEWISEAVGYVSQLGIMNGMTPEYFGVAENLSRTQFAVILYRIMLSPAVTAANPFSDIEAGKWYTDAVLWAAEKGIVTGYEDGRFGPADNITREQMAAMLFRFADYIGLDTSKRADLSSFPDASDVSPWALDAIQWAVGIGMIKGDQGRINPQGSVNRAVCATMIMRFIKSFLPDLNGIIDNIGVLPAVDEDLIPDDVQDLIPHDIQDLIPDDVQDLIPEDIQDLIPEDISDIPSVSVQDFTPDNIGVLPAIDADSVSDAISGIVQDASGLLDCA